MQTPRVERPHPRTGGSGGYSPPYRIDAVRAYQAGRSDLVTAVVRSIRRWIVDPDRKTQTGNAPARNLRGEHQFLLVFYRTVYPKATADEIITFIAKNSSDGAVYSRQDISKREGELGLSRKVGSTTAYQAFTPEALMRKQIFWTSGYPYGIVGTLRQLLVDIDEAGFWLETCNRRRGKAVSFRRVREAGPYGHGEKWTLILAIDCAGHRWAQFARMPGTTVEIYDAFIRSIISSPLLGVPVGSPGFVQRTFMHDNLSAHHATVVHNTITAAGHRVLSRPPYRPHDGPIEYQFNILEQGMCQRVHHIHNDDDMVRELHAILANMGAGFDATFVHCGYA